MRLKSKLIPAVMALLLAAIGLTAQSTSPSSPTPVNGEYKGKGPSSETNYYFSFSGGPGDVSVRLDLKAKDYSTFARIEIGNDPSNLIAMHNMNASTTTGSSSVTKDFTLAEQQTVRIKLTLDGNLAEYTLSINGGGPIFSSGSGSSGNSGSGKAGTGGKFATSTASKIGSLASTSGGNAGKFATSGASKIGSLGSTGGKPKPGTENSNSAGKEKLSFTCPSDIMYKIVPPGDWKPGFFGQMRFLFHQASVSSPILSCTYTSLTGQESVTILQNIPAGYTCEVGNGGPKTRDIICTVGPTAIAPPPAGRSTYAWHDGSSR